MNKQAELKIELLKQQKEALESKVQKLQEQIGNIDSKIERILHFETRKPADSQGKDN